MRLSRLVLIGFVCAAVAIAAAIIATEAPARAQEEPPPAPFGLQLIEQAPGAYRLEFRPEGDVEPYSVTVFTSRIGSDQGVGAELLSSDDSFSITLPLPLHGMTAPGCYRVGFSLRPADQSKPSGDPTADIEAYGCVDEAGVTTFPSHDSVISPPPAPPSNVQITRHPDGTTYGVAWQDESDDEIAFDVGMVLLDRPWGEGGAALGQIEFPLVAANNVAIGSIGFFFTPDIAERRCGYAMVLVFAVGGDSPSIWPGNATVPACFGPGEISFPDTGGAPHDRDAPQATKPVSLAALGCLLVLTGTALRARARISC